MKPSKTEFIAPKTVVVLVAVLLTVACSSSSDQTLPRNDEGSQSVISGSPTAMAIGLGEIDGPITQVGSITINESDSFNASASFSPVDPPITIEELAATRRLVPSDQCSVTFYDPLLIIEPPFSEGPGPDDFISAGEVVLLSGSEGSYSELVPQENLPYIRYHTFEAQPAAPAPDPIFVDIPGDDFPAFSNVGIAQAAALSGNNIDLSDTVNADTVLTWQEAPSDDHVIVMVLFTSNSAELDIAASVSCDPVDDGQFVLPAPIVEELDAVLGQGWTLEVGAFSRRIVNAYQQGSSVLLITRQFR